jgi:hypothetical protein
MEPPDLERIRFTTKHFNDLQGLRLGVPLGLMTLGCAGPAAVRIVLFLGALLLMVGAKRYYRNAFGAVEQQSDDFAALSIYSPAGPIPRLAMARPAIPFVRPFLMTVILALAVFTYFQALPPNVVIAGDGPLGQHPRVFREPAPLYAPPWIHGYPHGNAVRPPSMLRAVFAQTAYVVYGSFFLAVWFWRQRRQSQGYHLALAVLLLALAALGTSLGYLARQDGGIPPRIDLVLPALVYPGVALLVCGSALVLAGLLDHWQLVRALGRPQP